MIYVLSASAAQRYVWMRTRRLRPTEVRVVTSYDDLRGLSNTAEVYALPDWGRAIGYEDAERIRDMERAGMLCLTRLTEAELLKGRP